jgi:hypothetical protein
MTHRPTDRDLNATELRRAARELSADAQRETAAMARAMDALLQSDADVQQRTSALVGRRRFLQIGGFTVATSAVIAACGGTSDPSIARVGNAPTTTALPDAAVNDIVLLRTASSLEHSAVAVYDLVIADADLLDPALRPIAQRFRDDHAGHAALFEKLTRDNGGEPWTCGNPRIDEFVITPALNAIVGAEATENNAASRPSDDPRRDVLQFAHALEVLAGATYQALVPVLSMPSLRAESITIGTHEVRHAALLAIAMTGRPDGYVSPTVVESTGVEVPETTVAPTTTQDIATPLAIDEGDEPAPPPTPIPTVYAIPSQFGLLSPVQVVIGSPDPESGNRTTLNLETPSLNSFVYEYLEPSCDA